MLKTKLSLPKAEQALSGREEQIPIENKHYVHGRPIQAPFSDDDSRFSKLLLGMGCFWGVERLMWKPDGVYVTAAGYAGGEQLYPTYEMVCNGSTGHAEVVQVVFDRSRTSLEELLKVFWENHDPTQANRQGNDKGTQYRSAIYCDNEEDLLVCEQSRDNYQAKLSEAGFGKITTEIAVDTDFYLAEEPHQQYLAKNPGGYCNHGFCQVEYS